MRREQTDAGFRQGDDQPQARPVVRLGTAARTLAQPMNPAANIRATVWLIACLLLVWAVIVAA